MQINRMCIEFLSEQSKEKGVLWVGVESMCDADIPPIYPKMRVVGLKALGVLIAINGVLY